MGGVTFAASTEQWEIPAWALAGLAVVHLLGLIFVVAPWWTGRRQSLSSDDGGRVMLANWLALASLLGGLAVPPLWEHGVVGAWPTRVMVVFFLVAFAGSFAIRYTIIWFNRPRLLVPPRLRGQPGRWQRRQMRGSPR